MSAEDRIGRRTSRHAIVGVVLTLALVAVWGLIVGATAAATRDPNDVGGPLDIRSVGGDKEALSAPLTVTVRTWGTWSRRLLRENGPNRLFVRFDVDGDERADATARVMRSGGRLTVELENDDGSLTTLPASRPSRSTITLVVPDGAEANPSGEVGIAATTRSSAGAACDPVCRDRSPDEGFDLVVPGESPSPTPTNDDVTCTEVVGFSQTAQWALQAPDFQDAVGDAEWQVRWAPGAAIYFWADPDFEGWEGEAQSRCETGADAPDRIVLTISSQNYEDDSSVFVPWIQDAIAAARSRYPSVEQVVLQPVVGGPGNGACVLGDGDRQVRASHNHPLIDAAIAQVVGGSVVAGPSPEVRTCDDYADSAGHLVADARGPIGLEIAAGYP